MAAAPAMLRRAATVAMVFEKPIVSVERIQYSLLPALCKVPSKKRPPEGSRYGVVWFVFEENSGRDGFGSGLFSRGFLSRNL